MLKTISEAVLMFTLASVLCACGGGGSGSSSPDNASNESGTDEDSGGDNTGGDVTSETLLIFSGLESDNLGSAAWNTNPGAAEPVKTGHEYTICNMPVTAYYYYASREHVDASKIAGLRVEEIVNMPNFESALNANGFTASQVTMTWGVSSLGEDKEGQDWKFEGLIETRYYTGGQRTLYLNGEPMVQSQMPMTTITIDYRDECDLNDDIISGSTDFGSFSDASANSSASVRAVAAAFLEDIGNRQVAFEAVTFQPAVLTDFIADGRWGAFFEIPAMNMLVEE